MAFLRDGPALRLSRFAAIVPLALGVLTAPCAPASVEAPPYGGKGQSPPFVKNAGCPPNIGGRDVGAATAGFSAFKSPMFIIPSTRRFQRSSFARPGSGTGWPK